MKTKIRKWVAGAIATLLFAAMPAAAQGPYYFWWQVIDERDEAYTGQNVNCSVFRANEHAAAILHTGSTLPNPGGNSPLWSDASGKLHFWSTSSTPVDVTCYYANGGSAQINKLDRFTHKVMVPRQGSAKVSRFSVSSTATATNQTTGITIPSGAVVRDVIIQNLNPKAVPSAYHISVGFAGNHAVSANVNALVNAQALTSPDEWLRPHITGDFVANHRGVALSRAHGSGVGSYYELPYMVHVSSGLDVVYAVSVPAPVGGVRVHVYILWDQLHTGINRLGLTN